MVYLLVNTEVETDIAGSKVYAVAFDTNYTLSSSESIEIAKYVLQNETNKNVVKMNVKVLALKYIQVQVQCK